MTSTTPDSRRDTARRTAATTSCCPSWSRTCGRTGPSCAGSGPTASPAPHLLTAMTQQEIFSEATSVYDNYVEVLETGSVEALQHYARDLSERIIPRGVETHEVVGIVLLLRDVLARSLFEKYHQDFALLNRVLDAYEPAANRIANTVAVSFVRGAGAGHPAAAGQPPGAVHAGPAGPGAAADPADHRRARRPARPPAHRAAARRDPHAPGEGGGHRHHRRAGRGRGRWPTTWCRPSTPPG